MRLIGGLTFLPAPTLFCQLLQLDRTGWNSWKSCPYSPLILSTPIHPPPLASDLKSFSKGGGGVLFPSFQSPTKLMYFPIHSPGKHPLVGLEKLCFLVFPVFSALRGFSGILN